MIDLSRLLLLIAEGRRQPEDVAKDLQKIANYAAGIVPQKAATPGVDTKPTEDDIFAYWRTASGKTHAKFTPERRAKVRTRLRDGYEAAAIKRAIDFVCSDPWHTGGNPEGKIYTDLELICRNGTKLERYIDEAGTSAATPAPANDGKAIAIENMKGEAKRALDRNDHDAYNRAQQAIKQLRRE
jgi:hypothetical protein